MLTILKSRISGSMVGQCLKVLSPTARRKVLVISFIQVSTNLLDLIGVALAGVLGALAVSGVESQEPGFRIMTSISFLGLSNKSIQAQVAVIGLTTALLLIVRTLLSVVLLRRTLFFLSSCGSKISGDMAAKFFNQPVTFIRSRSSQETVFAITRGVDAITVGVIGTTIAFLSDVSLLVILTSALLVVDAFVAFGTFLMFTGFAWVLYFLLHTRAEKLGSEFADLGIQASSRIIESIGTYRELLVHNRRSYYVAEIRKIRTGIARSYSEIAFLPSISKYSIEVMMVLATLGLSAAEFYSTDASHAVGRLAIFIAASSRIAPAALRIQQGALQLKTSVGSAEVSLKLINELGGVDFNENGVVDIDFEYSGFEALVVAKHLDFSYQPGKQKTLDGANIKAMPGSLLALVGPSGAGKTTLIDLILGVIEPNSGEISISGLSPLSAISRWPGAISYVPQETFVIEGTIRENITLGYADNQITDTRVIAAIQKAQLSTFINTLPDGIDTQVGEQGTRLSGGQRQRLGIARALVTNPKLLVLDEATSALDAETEHAMTHSIQELKGNTTVIIVAHRLSTVMNADQLIYLDNGLIRATGSFDELRSQIPEFDNQSKLLGL
jgi:ATP-binding cassette, subfamily B, bacterial PglK